MPGGRQKEERTSFNFLPDTLHNLRIQGSLGTLRICIRFEENPQTWIDSVCSEGHVMIIMPVDDELQANVVTTENIQEK